MYYKRQGIEPPVIKTGCVYEESFSHDGYLFLKYYASNVPSEELIEVSKEEYETNKPVIEEPEPAPQPLSETEQAILQTAINTEYIMSLMEVKG